MSVLLALPLKAQVWYGNLGDSSTGRFYLDTSQYIGWKKVKADEPWVRELPPSLVYWDWWQETARCQEFTVSYAQFRKYRFFAVNRDIFGGNGPLQLGYIGYHLIDSMAIYIARPYINNKAVLVHEFTHALMFLNKERAGHTFRRFGPFGCSLNYVTWKTADKP